MRTEARPIKGADAGGGPVVAEAVDTFDNLRFGVVFGDGRVGARFVVPGADVAPGRF